MIAELEPRLPYASVRPDLFGKFAEASLAAHHGTLERKLLLLVDLRASQINRCAFCLDMHSKQAKLAGERELRIYALPAWRESPLFSPRERAALALTEAVTELGADGVAEAVWAEAREQFSDDELVQLTASIALINLWNRLAITFRSVPGSFDRQFGLEAAGLS